MTGRETAAAEVARIAAETVERIERNRAAIASERGGQDDDTTERTA